MFCAAYKSQNPDGNHFCGNCGAALSPIGLLSSSTAGLVAAPDREGGKRRRVVLLFSDVASSTEIG